MVYNNNFYAGVPLRHKNYFKGSTRVKRTRNVSLEGHQKLILISHLFLILSIKLEYTKIGDIASTKVSIVICGEYVSRSQQ